MAALQGVEFEFKNDGAQVLRPQFKIPHLNHGDLVVLSSPTDPLFPEVPSELEMSQKLVQAVTVQLQHHCILRPNIIPLPLRDPTLENPLEAPEAEVPRDLDHPVQLL